jgi:hypothetical protein
MANPYSHRGNSKPNEFVGLLLLLGLVVPHALWLVRGYEDVQDWEGSIWAFFTAIVLFQTFKVPDKNFLFRCLNFVFTKLHMPPGKIWPLIYSGAFILIGLYYLGRQFGIAI